MTFTPCYQGFALTAVMALAAVHAPAQERVMTTANRTHLDATFSPDGRFIAYQAKGTLYVQASTGGGEAGVFNAGQAMTYLWEANSQSFLIFSGDKLTNVSRDGQTKRTIVDLAGKGVQDFFFITPNRTWVYGVRRVQQKTYVMRVRLTDGKLEDIITTIPGVTSVDIDATGKKLLITATVFLFTYNFFQADEDGKNVSVIGQALGTPADHGRWLDGTKTFMFEHTGMYNSVGSGFQVWTMDIATTVTRPLTWTPRQRKAVPALSPDGKWITSLEFDPSTNRGRAVVFPKEGGGEVILSTWLFQMGNRIRMSSSGQSVIYVGAEDLTKNAPSVRIYDLDRLLHMSPQAQPGRAGQISLPLKQNEAGLVLLGFGLATNPITVPGLKGTLGLNLASGVMLLYTAASTELKGPWLTPNDTAIVGQTVFLQGVRLNLGQGLSGDFLPVTHIDIGPK